MWGGGELKKYINRLSCSVVGMNFHGYLPVAVFSFSSKFSRVSTCWCHVRVTFFVIAFASFESSLQARHSHMFSTTYSSVVTPSAVAGIWPPFPWAWSPATARPDAARTPATACCGWLVTPKFLFLATNSGSFI